MLVNQSRSEEKEMQISKTLANLLKLSNINLKSFQTSLFRNYENLNEKLQQDLLDYCQSKAKTAKNVLQRRFFFSAIKFFFDVHYTALKKFLGTIKKVFLELGKQAFKKT